LKEINSIIRKIERSGSLEEFYFMTKKRKKLWTTALEIDINGHMRILKAAQRFVDESISKTFNVPNSTSVKKIEDLIKRAHKEGIKGISIFRDGSLNERVLLKKK